MKMIRLFVEIFVLSFNAVLLWNHDWKSMLAFWIGTFIVTLLQSVSEFEFKQHGAKLAEKLKQDIESAVEENKEQKEGDPVTTK